MNPDDLEERICIKMLLREKYPPNEFGEGKAKRDAIQEREEEKRQAAGSAGYEQKKLWR